MFFSLRAYLAIVLCLFFSLPSQASTLEAKSKAYDTATGLLSYIDNKALQNGYALIQEGDLQVERADTYFAVTLPHLKLKNPTQQTFVNIGIITLNMTPAENNENDWKMSLSLPSPIFILDAEDKTLAQITLDQQKTESYWNDSLQTLSVLNTSYSDLKLSYKKEDDFLDVAHIENITLNHNLDEGNEKAISTLSLNGLNIKHPLAQNDISVDSLELSVNLGQFDIKRFKSAQEETRLFMDSMKTLEPGQMISGKSLQALSKTVMEGLLKSIKVMNLNLNAQGLSFLPEQTPLNINTTAIVKAPIDNAASPSIKMQSSVTGLADTKKHISALIGAPDITDKSAGELQSLFNFITLAQLLGQQNSDGAHEHDFELTSEGRILLNGIDLSLLLGGSKALNKLLTP